MIAIIFVACVIIREEIDLFYGCDMTRDNLDIYIGISLDSECEVSIRDAGRLGRSALPEKE